MTLIYWSSFWGALYTGIFGNPDIVGNDFTELIENYAKEFQVNLDGYLWYFHRSDEGMNIFNFLFKPPNEKVERIPVSPAILLNHAQKQPWDMTYPKQDKSINRRDLVYSNVLLITIFVV